MKKIMFIILIPLFFTNTVFAEVHRTGALDKSSGSFFYAGFSAYYWSGYKNKEFRKKYNYIYKYDFEKKETVDYYTGDCSYWDLWLSFGGEYLGAHCKRAAKLTIIDVDKAVAAEKIDNVQKYKWPPLKDKLIYLTGKMVPRGDDSDLKPDGIWLYDMVKKTKKRIAEKGWDFRADIGGDKYLYMWNGVSAMRYEYATGKSHDASISFEETQEFSPDGRYYTYSIGGEGIGFEEPYWSPFRIYDTLKNYDLPPEKIGYISERNPFSLVWGADSKLFACSARTARKVYERQLYVYDIEAGKPVKQFKGEIAGYDNERKTLVIHRAGKFYLESFK